MELGLMLIFWYGVLHAFGADHLTAIADFSIGKSKQKTLFVTFAFALGHGVMLFAFAQLLSVTTISQNILGYADKISALVIIAMGLYFLFLVVTQKIHVTKHMHGDVEHIHISYSKQHQHDTKERSSAFAMGALMGIGGVRGMLVTLAVIDPQSVDIALIGAFILGVSLVFVTFGYLIHAINQKLLHSTNTLHKIFATLGATSVAVGVHILVS